MDIAEALRYWDYDHGSGAGSTSEFCAEYISFVAKLIRDEGVKTVADLGCGDFVVGSAIDYGDATVVGVDASTHHIARHKAKHEGNEKFSFVHADVESFDASGFDLVLCKDVLQHWPTERIFLFLANARPRLMLLTNDYGGGTVNGDIEYLETIGTQLNVNVRGLDLNDHPFNVGGVEVLRFNGKSCLLLKRD